jgi:hypothetical protein
MNYFEDIRPYRDEEIPGAMQRIVESDAFPLLASWIFPYRDLEDIRRMMLSFKTIRDFQLQVMIPVNEQIEKRSITRLSYSGFDQLDPSKQYLFVSNHRDIMLDASLLQYLLVKNGRDTTEITFGANLHATRFSDRYRQIQQDVSCRKRGTIEGFLHVFPSSERLYKIYVAGEETKRLDSTTQRTDEGRDRQDRPRNHQNVLYE